LRDAATDASVEVDASDAGAAEETGSDAASTQQQDSGNDGGVSDGASLPDSASDAGSTSDAAVTCPAGLDGGAGCAELLVPLSGSGQQAHFMFSPPSTVDVTGGTITAVVIAPGATAGVVQAYVQHGASPDGGAGGYSPSFLGWKDLAGLSTWTTLSWPVKSAFDNTGIARIGLSVESGSATDASTFQQPATALYVASITATGPDGGAPVASLLFDGATTISRGTYPASQIFWLNTSDTPYVTQSSVTWLPSP
jgi:hypothetical protein